MEKQYRHIDTKRPDGCYVSFSRNTFDIPDNDPTDYLFQDPDYQAEDQARLDAFHAGDWYFVGIVAKAHILVVQNGVGTMCELESAGLWGIESDSGEDYFAEIFGQECENLKSLIAALGNPTYVGE